MCLGLTPFNAGHIGGAIWSEGALTITNSTFSGNSADTQGGAIHNAVGATLTISNSTITGNTGGTWGGGISSFGTLMTLANSTISDNSAANGGGIFNDVGTMTITNSTMTGNNATYGGGTLNYGKLTITNSTITGNSATFGGGISSGGVLGSTGTLVNTIVANNPSGGNCRGTITNGGNNIDDGTTCAWGSTDGSMSSTDPLLGALVNNGGPTQTFALLAGSPAIDGVTFNAPNGAPSTDQRGFTRPQGVLYDIGAFESEAQVGPDFIVNTSVDTDDGSCDLLGQGIGNKDCTLREAIDAANALAGANTITFSVSGTITLVSTLPDITDAAGLTIDGTGQTVTISGDDLYQVLLVGVSASLTLDYMTVANGNIVSGAGGGIRNNEGTLTITNSTISDNSAVGVGGGIYNYGTLTITNSTVSGNSATLEGGGVFNGFSSTLTITNSTFSDNDAIIGGGIKNSNLGTLTVTNSTFSGNSADVGGGIENNGSTVTFLNTIVANSTLGGNCSGTITNGGNNIDDGTTCGWGSANGSMSSTDPLLGTLADNGGPTQTFALLAGSPAIDGVMFNTPNGAPSTDQRGVARPQGVLYDIGAYEYGFPYSLYLPLILR
jgi:CSLREA domain-containing protein